MDSHGRTCSSGISPARGRHRQARPQAADDPSGARIARRGIGRDLVSARGRRLRSSNSPEQCAAILTQVFDGYRARRYPELPLLVPTGVRWLAAETAPAISLSGRDQADNWLLITLARVPGGTEAGVFGLEDIGQVSIIGHWKMRDVSLTSTGLWPAKTVAVTPPPVEDEIVAATLRANNYPVTSKNLQLMAGFLFDGFLAKAHTFISGHDGEAAATRFVQVQRRQANYSSPAGPLRSTLQALAEWNSEVLPYLQDLPFVAQSVLLYVARETGGNGGIWADLEL
jgi:hypothetical protein